MGIQLELQLKGKKSIGSTCKTCLTNETWSPYNNMYVFTMKLLIPGKRKLQESLQNKRLRWIIGEINNKLMFFIYFVACLIWQI